MDMENTQKQDLEKTKMTIVSKDGSTEEVEIVVAFEFKDTGKEYVVYTKNEKDENGNVTIYVSSITRVGEEITLNTVSDDNEWTRIKDLLRELSKSE